MIDNDLTFIALIGNFCSKVAVMGRESHGSRSSAFQYGGSWAIFCVRTKKLRRVSCDDAIPFVWTTFTSHARCTFTTATAISLGQQQFLFSQRRVVFPGTTGL